MTEHDEDASIGRLSRELASARRRHEAAYAELRRRATKLRDLGTTLLEDPDRVVFPGGVLPVSSESAFLVNEDLSIATVRRLLVDEQDARATLRELEDRARRAGL
jgi:hypothetical protein